MHIADIFVLAVALAMDAFAVAVACGFVIKHPQIRHALRIALFFGLFQAMMPVLGWLAGSALRAFITTIDHWIVFGLLSLIGGKMILEGLKPATATDKVDPLLLSSLLGLSIATSMDALAAGISMAFLKVKILLPVLIIGVTTFILSFLGVEIGKQLGHVLGNKIKIFGGIVLIVLGVKILVEHV